MVDSAKWGRRRLRSVDDDAVAVRFNAMHVLCSAAAAAAATAAAPASEEGFVAGDRSAGDGDTPPLPPPDAEHVAVDALTFCGSAAPEDGGARAIGDFDAGFDAGLVAAGGSSSASARVVVDFDPAARFVQPPVVLAIARGQNFSDTFALSIRRVSNASVEFNVLRVDTLNDYAADGWAQELEIEFIALALHLRWPRRDDGRQPRAPDGVLHQGTAVVGNHSGSLPATTFSVRWNDGPPGPAAWASALADECDAGGVDCAKLRVFAAARNARGTDYDDVFSVVVCAIDRDGFSVRITRLDAQTGWDQRLELDYVVARPVGR